MYVNIIWSESRPVMFSPFLLQFCLGKYVEGFYISRYNTYREESHIAMLMVFIGIRAHVQKAK